MAKPSDLISVKVRVATHARLAALKARTAPKPPARPSTVDALINAALDAYEKTLAKKEQ